MPSGLDKNKIAVIGVPSSAGARKVGQEQGPGALRATGLLESLQSGGHEVIDLGDLAQVTFFPDPGNPRSQNLPLVLDVCGKVNDAVIAAVESRGWPLILGGDCSITVGAVAALSRQFDRLGMAYIDGDLDLNTPETTASGIFDGMVLGHILGGGADELRNIGSRCPLLEQQNIVLFGYSAQAGGIDPVEFELLEQARMKNYPLEEIRTEIKRSAQSALSHLEDNTDHFLVHFDLDVIDFDEFPAVDVPHRPGLTFEQARDALAVFLSSRKSVGLIVTEFNAAMDRDGMLARRLADLIRDVLLVR